jgi:hypothetical protein
MFVGRTILSLHTKSHGYHSGAINKQLLDEVFVISVIIKVEVSVISLFGFG